MLVGNVDKNWQKHLLRKDNKYVKIVGGVKSVESNDTASKKRKL